MLLLLRTQPVLRPSSAAFNSAISDQAQVSAPVKHVAACAGHLSAALQQQSTFQCLSSCLIHGRRLMSS